MKIRGPVIVILVLIALAVQVHGGSAECQACKGGFQDWTKTATDFLSGNTTQDNAVPTLYTARVAREQYEAEAAKSNANTANTNVDNTKADTITADPSANDTAKQVGKANQEPTERSSRFLQALAPISSDIDADVVLDISPNATEYIPGAVSLNYENFLDDSKKLKPASELAKLLGNAGISQDDSVVIYGECQPCGGGPSAATYVYWIMKYLGHEKVRVLDGGIDDWVAAKKPTETTPANLTPKSYIPMLKPELLATYDYVRNGQAQIVDARTVEEFEAGSIPGAVNIPYESVLDGKRIKDEASLKELFAGLAQDRPVIVYTSTGVKATMVWFALSLLGYDSRVYSWQDWLDHQPKINISLKEATADPNPAKTGDVVKITAVFEEETAAAPTAPTTPPAAAAEVATESAGPKQENASNETVLTIKGCATCGFGSPQGFADISSDTGVVQIGAKGKPSASDNGFRCTAIVNSPSGTEIGKVIMKRIAGDEFAGIWNANVASGNYSVDIVASAGEATKTFADALEIEVAGSSKYKNLG